MQRAIYREQQTTCNAQQATCPSTSCNMQRPTTTCNATDAMRQTPCNRQQATGNGQQTACNGHQTTRQPATGGMRETPRKRRQAAGNASNEQRAAFNGQHSRGREHMRDATGDTRHCHISCAAGSRPDQHARSIVLDNQCATRHRRHTQGATYEPCRSMQQPRMEIHGARRTKSECSRTSGLCRARWLRWTLGGGLTAR
jgi:hypothetical protein